jgi:hypothetical protein
VVLENLKAQKIMVALCLQEEGDHHYLLLKALPIYAQEDPYMIKFLGQQKYINIVTKVVWWIDGVCISYPTYLQTQGFYLVKVGA